MLTMGMGIMVYALHLLYLLSVSAYAALNYSES